MTDSVIEFDNVGLAYRRTLNPFKPRNWVLKEVSFAVNRGEVLGVIGRNGAGKSTLLRLLADVIAPDKGRVFRRDHTRCQLLTLSLGFIDKLSGYDNTIISLVTQGITIREARGMVDDIVEFAEIPHLMDQPVGTFSNGERARLGFSIAMKARPDVVLLDELLGVGDQNFKKKSSEALRNWVNSEQTCVLVSHSPPTLRQTCQRVIWLEAGEIKMQGKADEVLKEYSEFMSQLK